MNVFKTNTDLTEFNIPAGTIVAISFNEDYYHDRYACNMLAWTGSSFEFHGFVHEDDFSMADDIYNLSTLSPADMPKAVYTAYYQAENTRLKSFINNELKDKKKFISTKRFLKDNAFFTNQFKKIGIPVTAVIVKAIKQHNSMIMTISLKQQLESFNSGIIVDSSGNDDSCYNFYDWFCTDSALKRKATKLYKNVQRFVRTFNIDTESTYCFFKNNCPMSGPRYDDFRICDRESGDVIFTVIPKSGHNGKAEIWGRANNFNEPLYTGKNLSEIYSNLNLPTKLQSQAEAILEALLLDKRISQQDIDHAVETILKKTA